MSEKTAPHAKRIAGRIALYQTVFGSNEGQRVLEDLMATHHVMGSTFDPNTNLTIFREGERNVILRIIKILKMDAKGVQEGINNYAKDHE